MITDPRLAQRVRVAQDHYDAKFRGRVGSIAKICSAVFHDYTYVHLDMRPRERVKKVLMFPLKHLEEEPLSAQENAAGASP